MTEEQLVQNTEPTGDESPEQAEPQADEAAASEPSGESPAAEPKKDGVQKRIDEITRARREAEREAEYWRNKAMQAPAQQPTQQQPPAEQPPTPTQFQTYDDYVTARAQYEARQTAVALFAQAEQQRAYQAAQQAAAQRVQSLNEKLIADGAKYEDFDAVVRDQSLPITGVMVEALGATQNPADIAYYLGKNRTEAARISRLAPVQQALEIARLETKLAAKPQQKTVSSAPEPTPTLQTRREAATAKNPENMSVEEYKAWRWPKKQKG